MIECDHPVVVGSLCALCGSEISAGQDLFCALHSTEDIKITQREALEAFGEKLRVLEERRKLILVLDLDQTVLHTVCDAPDVDYTVRFSMDNRTYSVKFRPNLGYMLERLSGFYEIHIYTMGTREYAEKIAEHIDPDGTYFHDRIVTRDENLGLLSKSLDRLFPSNHRNVVVLDDRADIWSYSKNLVLVKPFWHYNQVDINDPSLLRKRLSEEEAAEKDAKKRKVEEIKDPEILNKLEEMVLNSAIVEDRESKIEDLMCSERRPLGQAAVEGKGTGGSLSRGRLRPRDSLANDQELVKITELLTRVHKRYFASKQRNIKNILSRIRKRIFRGLRFFIPESHHRGSLSRLVGLYGGRMGKLGKTTDVIISGRDDAMASNARKYGCVVVSPRWVADCIYSLRRMEYGRCLVFDGTLKDEYEEELEKAFF
jgi:RNA polymerase II subunit A C-terminal domain phosphatase